MTFWTSKDNYGQLLQVYALQQVLKKMGHNPYLIRYVEDNDPTFASKWWERAFHVLCNPLIIIRFFKRKREQKKQLQREDKRHFDDFLSTYINVSENIYRDYKQLKENPPYADAYICGSDVIWSPRKTAEPYFLNFDSSAMRIAYSPSFGTGQISNDFLKKIEPWLKRFQAVSVRELEGAEICQKLLHREVVCNPDPTALLLKEDYIESFEIQKKEENTCFVYLLGHETNIDLEKINSFVKKQSLSLKLVTVQKSKIKGNFHPRISEWLEAIYNSKYVFTNSFHGCVVAILFNKKFLFFPLAGESTPLNNRIYSLFKRWSIPKERIYQGNIEKVEDDINYEEINFFIKETREKGLNWIEKYL